VIAHAGQTGNVTSPQLHFEIRKGSTPVDPTKYLGGAGGFVARAQRSTRVDKSTQSAQA